MLKFQDDYITKNENMEDLFTIILAIVDDLYKTYAPEEVKNRRNIAEARCSDAEIITISIVGEMMGVDSETAWHSFVKKNYSHLFPHLCCRSRYHRRKKNLYLLTELPRAKLEKEMDVGLCERTTSRTAIRCRSASSEERISAKVSGMKEQLTADARLKKRPITVIKFMF